jgi:hypothetical protein
MEVQRGLKTVSEAVRPLKERMAVSWIVDRGFDDVAVWRTIWEQDEHLVCRISHTERLVAYQAVDGEWLEGDIAAAREPLRPLASAQTEMVVRRGRQKKKKRQKVTAEIRSCPLHWTYDSAVRRQGEAEPVPKDLWLVEVEVLRSSLKPWFGWRSSASGIALRTREWAAALCAQPGPGDLVDPGRKAMASLDHRLALAVVDVAGGGRFLAGTGPSTVVASRTASAVARAASGDGGCRGAGLEAGQADRERCSWAKYTTSVRAGLPVLWPAGAMG